MEKSGAHYRAAAACRTWVGSPAKGYSLWEVGVVIMVVRFRLTIRLLTFVATAGMRSDLWHGHAKFRSRISTFRQLLDPATPRICTGP